MMHAESLKGTWESDHERTLWELRRTLGPDHLKTVEYAGDRSTLILHYAESQVTYYFRDMVCSATLRILTEDEVSLVCEVEPCDLNEQRLWHLHFLDSRTYWVTVDLDWGHTYREFFKKLDDSMNHEGRVERAFRSWEDVEPITEPVFPTPVTNGVPMG